MKKTLFILLILNIVAPVAWSDVTDPKNSADNPAFLANSHRKILDIGIISADVGLQNSYLGLTDISSLLGAKVLVLDFGKIVQEIGPGGLKLGLNLNTNTFSTIHIGPVGVGAYLSQEFFFSSAIPTTLFQLVNEGWSLDTPVTGNSDVFLQDFVKVGAYGSFQWNNYVFAGKLGAFIPLAYTDDASFNYSFEAQSTGKIKFSAGAQFPIYTALPVAKMKKADGTIDFSTLTADLLMEGLNTSSGFNIDAGVTYRDPKTHKSMYGGAILKIPLVPSKVSGKILYDGGMTAEIDNLLGNASDPKKALTQTTTNNFVASEGDKSISVPFTLNGFYRQPLLPILDVVGTASLIMGAPFRTNLGATADLNLFNILDANLGIKADYAFGKTSTYSVYSTELGLGINLYIMEVVVAVSATGADPMGMLSAKGVNAKAFVAIGF